MQIDIQVVIMSAFPQDNSLQDNLVKCVNNELGHFEFAKDFVEKVVTQATTKHLLGAGMQILATYSYKIFASSSKTNIVFYKAWKWTQIKVFSEDGWAHFKNILGI